MLFEVKYIKIITKTFETPKTESIPFLLSI